MLQANIVALQNQVNNLNIRVTNNPPRSAENIHVTVSADETLSKPFQNFNATLGHMKLIPEDGIKLWLGNARNASTSADESAPVLNIAQKDLNVQLPYPFQNNPPATPYILEFGPGQKVWSITSEYSLELASSRAPYHFLLKSNKSAERNKALSITKSAQFIEELEAFLSIDTTSRRKYLLVGPHSVVLQIAPTGKVKIQPTIAAHVNKPGKTQNVHLHDSGKEQAATSEPLQPR
jgi:hypothetical protein